MKILTLLLICFGLSSCQIDNSIPIEEVKENLSISKNETLEYLLATAIPIEGGFSIDEQAEHFAISEIQHREQGIFYTYKPSEGFTGKDVVKIKRADSNGAEIISETIITLNIEVKN